jgi:PAS domain S-box-containing protein
MDEGEKTRQEILADAALRASEERYRVLAESAEDFIFRVGRDLRVEYVNAAGARALGMPVEDVLGHRIDELFPPETATHQREGLLGVLETGQTFTSEDRHHLGAGERWLSTTLTPLRGEGEEVVGILGVSRDVTDRMRAEEALRESELRFRQMADAIPVVFWMVSTDLRQVHYASPAFEEIWGRCTDELHQQPRLWLETIHPDDRERVASRLRERIASGFQEGGSEDRYRIVRPDGSVRSIEYRVHPMRDPRGKVVWLCGIARDVTERTQAEEFLRCQHDLATALSGAIDLDEGLRLCLDAALRVSDLDSGGIYLADAASGSLELAIHRGLGAEFMSRASHLVAGAPNTRLVMAGRAVYAQHLALGVPIDEVKRREGLRAIAVLPIGHQGRVIACLNVASHTRDEVPTNARECLETIAAQVGSSIARLRAEKSLRESEEKYRTLFESMAQGVFYQRADGELIDVNRAALQMFGLTRDQFLGRTSRDPSWNVIREDGSACPADEHPSMVALRTGEPVRGVVLGVQVPGRPDHTWLSIDAMPQFWAGEDGPHQVFVTLHDITDRRRMEAQLRHTQKMEAIGTLAGGIAHDFNNLLTPVLGYADMLQEEAHPGSMACQAAATIRMSAERASRLARQLLGFARKGKLLEMPVDMHRVVGDIVAITGRTVDRRITISLQLEADLPIVIGDPGQLEQVVMNLAVNACDAMPDGGELIFRTGRVELDEDHALACADSVPGSYVLLAVTDTGTGMTEEVRSRAFEPFFTTKPQGKGTGMGLAMVYGIVRNHGGFVTMTSQVGSGTTVEAYLPAAKDARRPEPDDQKAPVRGTGTILVVDDETMVRQVMESMLASLGYRVVLAGNGREAVDCYRARGAEIDLVILDLTMPLMDGLTCFRELKTLDPGVNVIVATGHSLEGAAQTMLDEGALCRVQKPFAKADISDALVKVFGGRGEAGTQAGH